VPDLYPHGVPIPGPIETDPSGRLGPDSIASARQMLDTVLDELRAADVELGAYDWRIIAWLAAWWDQPTIAVLASLLHRALHTEVPRA
jgi:hypothetical protein